MSKLKVFDLYNDSTISDSFSNNTRSVLEVSKYYNKVEVDYEWLDLMEDTIKYLDNILRNPNRFIINEEEIVKIELARRVTVESVKHLAKHTNLIQEIEDDGSVKPSKILNINKDESYNTYENRLIFTLINNMKMYLDMKDKTFVDSSSLKDDKKCEYNAVTKVGAERVNINMVITSKTDFSKKVGSKNGMSTRERFEKLKLRVADLTNTPVYIQLAKEHVAKVIPPVKKTNLILKNTNFQYAMKLWDFLQANMKDDTKIERERKNLKDDDNIKQMLDDSFLLDYLVMTSVDARHEVLSDKSKEELATELTNKMIDKIVELNADLPEEALEEILGQKIAMVRSKKEASIAELQNKFNDRISAFTNKILKFSFR
jgi:hypothetical protein